MNTWHRVGLLLFLLSFCIGCDQVTKGVAQETLLDSGPVSYLEDTVHFLYAENPGVAFSMGATLSPRVRFWVFTVGVGAILLGLLAFVLLHGAHTRLEVWAYGLVLGGGFSNVLDRILNDGRVIDFMVVRLGGLSTAVFNLADVIILMGLGALLWASFRRHRHPHPEAA